MKILFIVPYAPTLIRTRPYNFIRSLVRRGHSLTLATLWENDGEQQALSRLASGGIRVISARLTKARSAINMVGALASGKPLQSVYCWQPALARQLTVELTQVEPAFDVIHIEHLRGAEYGLNLKSRLSNPNSHAGPQLPIIWDSVDCISLLFDLAARHSRSRFGRWVARLELARTRRYEGHLARQFNRVLVTSHTDAAALQKVAVDDHQPMAHSISVLPNGVDLEYFTPNFGPRAPNTLVLTGKMSYHANITAALHLVQDIMPHVWERRPDVHVSIVGKAPPREVQALSVHYPGRVTVTGYVPDLRPYLWQSALAVAPVAYSAGIQNKVLEAMACATPVVATPQAASALQAHVGQDLLIADGAKAFAGELLRLLGDESLRQHIGAQGRHYVGQHHHWATIAGHLEEVYQSCMSQVS